MFRVKRILSVVLIISMIASLMPSTVLATRSSEDGIVEPVELKAQYNAKTNEAIVKEIPANTTGLILAGYQNDQMVFSTIESELATLPVKLAVKENAVFDMLKVFCLGPQYAPLTYAKQIYPVETFSVTFHANGDGVLNMPETQTVAGGELVEYPEEPTREGYLFVGWYTDVEGTTRFIFENTSVYSDVSLYAIWVDMTLDTDEDGLTDYIEKNLGLDPGNPDTDGNGVVDCDEDMDGDGVPNGREIELGSNPELKDSDMDDLDDAMELLLNTNIVDPDTDGDGADDGLEVEYGTDPCTYDESFTDKDASQPVGEVGPVAASVVAQVPGEVFRLCVRV